MIPLKICGITNINDALAAINNGANAIGFIFAKDSPRKISIKKAKEITKIVGNKTSKVGVFVNDKKDFIQEAIETIPLNMIQLHGDEEPSFCNLFNIPVIKAIQIENNESINKADKYNVNAILCDSYKKKIYGGTGISFDWNRLLKKKNKMPIILSGGINIKNVLNGINKVNPIAIDVNSGVETSPGKKSHIKLKNFYNKINKTRNTGFSFE